MAFVRRDRLIVARHEVPGYRCRETPVPEGRSKSLSVPGERAGVGHGRIIFWHFACENMFCDVSNSKPRSVQSSRWDEAISLVTPGTSCLATVSVPPGQKHRPAKARLTAYESASQRATWITKERVPATATPDRAAADPADPAVTRALLFTEPCRPP